MQNNTLLLKTKLFTNNTKISNQQYFFQDNLFQDNLFQDWDKEIYATDVKTTWFELNPHFNNATEDQELQSIFGSVYPENDLNLSTIRCAFVFFFISWFIHFNVRSYNSWTHRKLQKLPQIYEIIDLVSDEDEVEDCGNRMDTIKRSKRHSYNLRPRHSYNLRSRHISCQKYNHLDF